MTREAAKHATRPTTYRRRRRLPVHFSSRPIPAVLILIVALALLAPVYFLLREGHHQLEARRVLENGAECAAQVQQPCLTRESGTLLGPNDNIKQPGTEWGLRVGEKADEFTMPVSLTDSIKGLPPTVMVARWDGDIVALNIPEETGDDLVPVWGLGLRKAVMMTQFACAILGLALGIGVTSWRIRRAKGTWWLAPREDPTLPSPEVGFSYAALLIVPASVSYFALVVFSWWPIWALAALIPLVALGYWLIVDDPDGTAQRPERSGSA